MMPRHLSATDRRALRLGAIVVAPVLLWILVVRPYVTALSTARERLSDERALLVRERQVLAEAPEYPRRRLRAGTAMGTTWTRLVRGPDTLSVAAELATEVTDAASGAGLLVEQVETHSPDSLRAAALGRVGLSAAAVDLRARGDLDRALRFLDGLETGETLVRVDRLRLERAPSSTDAPDQETLVVAVTVTGIARVLSHPITAPPLPRRAFARRRASGSGAGDSADGGRAP